MKRNHGVAHENEWQEQTWFDTLNDALFLFDRSGTIWAVNQAACEQFHYSREQFLSMSMRALEQGVIDDAAAWSGKELEDGKSCLYETVFRRQDGSAAAVEVSARAIEYRGRPAVLATVRDISGKKALEAALKLSEERLEMALAGASDAIWDWCPDTGEIYVSPIFFAGIGYGAEQAEYAGRHSLLDNLVHPDDVPQVRQCLLDLAENRAEQCALEFRLRTASGHYLWLLGRGKVAARDGQGRPKRIAGTYCDITERKLTEDKLWYLGYHDGLTGLFNRAYFDQELSRLDQGGQECIGVAVFDIDGLKLINDTFGHDWGDQLLVQAAGILKRVFHAPNLVARMDGDEFAVIMPGAADYEVENACLRVMREMSGEKIHSRAAEPLGMSFGYAVSTPGNKTRAKDLFRIADNRMYRRKLHCRTGSRSTVVETLKQMLAARDYITEGHAERLGDLVTRMAGTAGMAPDELGELQLFAQFHDIGKVGVPDRILHKPGPLTPEERLEMKRHSETGYRIAQASAELNPIAEWILKHHEWWNGQGYPLGIAGDAIPVECRMLAIADAYDAMISDRPYRRAMAKQAAADELCRGAGVQFDPSLVGIFLQTIGAHG